MVDRREIITLCRQIGNMMEAGVDILRITQVLRAQTENERLLKIYNQFDHDLRMGASIAEAMMRASDIFSPFMISLVRQAEQRSDLESISAHVAAAFLKIAEFLQQDEDNKEGSANPAIVEAVISSPLDISAVADSANTWPLTLRAIENFTDRLQMIALRALTMLAGLLLSLAAVWYCVEVQWIEKQWQNVVLCSVSALFIAGAGVWVRRQIENEKRLAEQCSFCGHTDSENAPLSAIPGFPGAAICAHCAVSLGKSETRQLTPLTEATLTEAATAKSGQTPPAKLAAKSRPSAKKLTLQTTEKTADLSSINGANGIQHEKESGLKESGKTRPSPSRLPRSNPANPKKEEAPAPDAGEADYE